MKLGELTRSRVVGWGQKFVAEEGHRADTVTSFWVHRGKAGDIQHSLENEHGIVVARGIYEDSDKMIRIGHFGILQVSELRAALDSLGRVMEEVGNILRPVKVTKHVPAT
jgi:aspartate aminotransferase-like enzyme